MIQSTSAEAYHGLHDLGARQEQVLDVIKDRGPISNLEISEALALPINQITGRTHELRGLGLVQESHRDLSPITNRRVIFWSLVQEIMV